MPQITLCHTCFLHLVKQQGSILEADEALHQQGLEHLVLYSRMSQHGMEFVFTWQQP